MSNTVSFFMVALVMAAGLAGTVVPLLPGLPLIWAAALVYGFFGGFTLADAVAMTLISLLFAAGVVAKYALAGRRAGALRVPRSTLVAGALGGVAGFFVVPVIGFPLGGVLGVLLAERRRSVDWSTAWATARHVITGFGLGVLLEIGAGLLMIGCWAVWTFAQG